jgi:hypothetical protein
MYFLNTNVLESILKLHFMRFRPTHSPEAAKRPSALLKNQQSVNGKVRKKGAT